VSHEQNIILPDVKTEALYALWQELNVLNLATPNIGLITNIIACPGGDYCSLANAVSIPVATAIQERFDDLDYVHEIGELDLNLSGCMNSCGHHHVGHIGILGVEKSSQDNDERSRCGASAAIGRVIGPSFAREQVPDVISRLIQTYLTLRESEAERFIDVVDRVGIEPFKKDVYADPLLSKYSNLVRESNV
jgi:sulfite reductase (NADPH) hemoprotein beta-component